MLSVVSQCRSNLATCVVRLCRQHLYVLSGVHHRRWVQTQSPAMSCITTTLHAGRTFTSLSHHQSTLTCWKTCHRTVNITSVCPQQHCMVKDLWRQRSASVPRKPVSVRDKVWLMINLTNGTVFCYTVVVVAVVVVVVVVVIVDVILQHRVQLLSQWVVKQSTRAVSEWRGLHHQPTSGTESLPAIVSSTRQQTVTVTAMVAWPACRQTTRHTQCEVCGRGRSTISGCWLTLPPGTVHGRMSSSYRLPRMVSSFTRSNNNSRDYNNNTLYSTVYSFWKVHL